MGFQYPRERRRLGETKSIASALQVRRCKHTSDRRGMRGSQKEPAQLSNKQIDQSRIMPITKPRRRWFQFSLRTMLIAMVLSSGLFGSWVRWSREWISQRREALQAKKVYD